jgi:NADH-quinone oxidoreductase subunit I
MSIQQEVIVPSSRRTGLLSKVNALVQGLYTTAAEALSGQRVTQQYPEDHYVPFPRFRGRHVLRRHENGLEKCVGCALCAAVCPSHCIRVVGAENTEDHRISEGERYAEIYEIYALRCIWCGFCVEACPTEALGMTGEYEMASFSREATMYNKERLLEARPVNDGSMTSG